MDDIRLPVTEHLAELRSRVIIVLSAVLLLAVIIFPFSATLIAVIWNDLMADNITMVTYGPLEWLVLRVTFSIFCSILISMPLTIYEGLAFILPGLYTHERKFVYVVPLLLLLPLLGAAVAYFFVVPHVIAFLVAYSSGTAAAAFSAQQTLWMVMVLVAGMGLALEVPPIILLSVRMKVVTLSALESWRLIIYILLISIALSFSPDPAGIGQIIAAVFLVLLFEVGIILAKAADRALPAA